MPRTHAPYPPEFRRQMVELVRSGRSVEGPGSGGRGVKSRVVCKSERKLLDASVRLPWRPPSVREA